MLLGGKYGSIFYRQPQPKSCTAGDNNKRGEKALGEHAAVANEAGIGFVFQLLATRSAGNKAVKPTNSAARDGDEKERENDRRILGLKSHAGATIFSVCFRYHWVCSR